MRLNTSDAIAAYAAATATVALLWNVWQAVRSRRHHVELRLVHTLLVQKSGDYFRTVFLEVHNRGDHPIRVAAASISTPRVAYNFTQSGVLVSLNGQTHMQITGPTPSKAEEEADQVPTLPGVILARDGGARSIDDDLPDAVLQGLKAGGAAEELASDEALILELSKGLDNELEGWIQLSTGEPYKTTRASFDWSRLARLHGHRQ